MHNYENNLYFYKQKKNIWNYFFIYFYIIYAIIILNYIKDWKIVWRTSYEQIL